RPAAPSMAMRLAVWTPRRASTASSTTVRMVHTVTLRRIGTTVGSMRVEREARRRTPCAAREDSVQPTTRMIRVIRPWTAMWCRSGKAATNLFRSSMVVILEVAAVDRCAGHADAGYFSGVGHRAGLVHARCGQVHGQCVTYST